MRIITREERRKKAQEQTSRPNPRVFLFHFLYSEKEEKKRKKAVKGVIIHYRRYCRRPFNASMTRRERFRSFEHSTEAFDHHGTPVIVQ